MDTINASRIFEVKELFSEQIYKDKVYPYIAIVDAVNGQYDEQKCLTMPEFIRLDKAFYSKAIYCYPTPHLNACGADTTQSMVVGPDGTLYKCWNDIGISEYAVDNIFNDKYRYSKRYYDFMLYDATEDENCSNCRVLPLCMGALTGV